MAATPSAWEWVTPSGETVRARVDAAEGFESVYVGPRLVSRALIGGKPEGHAIPIAPVNDDYRNASPALVVRFDRVREVFELRANGHLVMPTSSPPSMSPHLRSTFRDPLRSPSNAWKWIFVVVVILGVGLVTARAARSRFAFAAEPPAGQFNASTGVVRFHYAAGYVPKPEVSEEIKPKAGYGRGAPPKTNPTRSSWITAGHYRRDEGIFVISVSNAINPGLDPWVLSNAFHKDFAEVMTKTLFAGKTPTKTETDRQEETCLGQPGSAAVTATLQIAGEIGTMWTCTLIHDGDAIMIGYFANHNVAADEPLLRKLANDTELLPK